MKITIYAMFTQLRQGDSIGEIFTSDADRRASLVAFIAELDEDRDTTTLTDGELMEIASNHGHDVHTFDEEIDIEVDRR